MRMIMGFLAGVQAAILAALPAAAAPPPPSPSSGIPGIRLVQAGGADAAEPLAARRTSIRNDDLPVYQGKGVAVDDTAPLNAFAAGHPFGFRIAAPVVISGTVQLAPSTRVICSNSERVTIDDTAVVGAPGFQVGRPDGSMTAGSFEIAGCRFIKFNIYDNGFSNYVPGATRKILNRDAHGEQHLAIYGGQHVRIIDDWFYDKPIGIDLVSSVDVQVSDSVFGGLWDHTSSGLQQSVAGIHVHNGVAALGTAQTTTLHHNYIAGGYASPFRLVPIGTRTNTQAGCIPANAKANSSVSNPPTDRAQTNCAPYFQENVGTEYGVWVESAEGFDFHDNYCGGQNASCLYFNTATAISEAHVSGNFFDASRGYNVVVDNQNAAAAVVNLRMHDDVFNGQFNGAGALSVAQFLTPPSTHTAELFGFDIHDENVANHFRAPFLLAGAQAGSLHHNRIAAYNVWNASPFAPNPSFDAGIIVQGASNNISVLYNTFGGGTNNFVGTGNFARYGVSQASTATGYAFGNTSVGFGLPGGGVEVGNVPASSSAPCNQGEAAMAPNGTFYVCRQRNRWVKFAPSPW